jgi:hypothetical protein
MAERNIPLILTMVFPSHPPKGGSIRSISKYENLTELEL